LIDIKDKIEMAPHFSYHEALWLPSWALHVYPPDEILENIIATAQKMELIRAHFKAQIFITSWYRPHPYNKLIGGAIESAHLLANAVDFFVKGYNCDVVRNKLRYKLEELSIRMENLPGADWIHIDRKEPGITGRYFIP